MRGESPDLLTLTLVLTFVLTLFLLFSLYHTTHNTTHNTDTTMSPDQRLLVYSSISPVAFVVNVGSSYDVVSAY